MPRMVPSEGPTDTQTLELVGRHRLASELLRAGLEVAFPSRDRGIDLIAYLDLDKQGRFVAKPIQMKAASRRSFSIMEKYAKFHEIILAYVWNLDRTSGDPETYALTYGEALTVGDEMGWLKTASWIRGKGYGTTQPGKRLCALLEPYRMDPATKWLAKIGTPPKGSKHASG